MINLMPPEASKIVVQEYWTRVFSAWLFLLSAIILIITIMMVPSYVLLRSQLDFAEAEVLEESDITTDFSEAKDLVAEANAVATQLNMSEEVFSFHEIITAIDTAAGVGIYLEAQDIAVAEEDVSSIHVRGVAHSREALANFKSALERSPLFETALIPISDLAREVDLPFAITVTKSSI